MRDLPQEGPSLAADEDEVIWGSYARLLGPLLNDGTWLEGRESMAPLFRGTPLETRSSLMKTLYRDHLPRVEHVLGCDPSLIWIWETWAHMITTVKSQAPANFLKHLVPCPVWEEQPIGPGLVRFAEKARQVGAWEILKHRVERALSRYIFQLQCSPSPKWDSQIHTGGGFRAWYLERLLEPAVEACIHLGHLDLVERWVKGLKAAPPVWIPLVGRAIGVARRLKRNDLVTRWEGLSPSGVFRAPERFLTTGSPVVAFQGQAPPTLEQSPLVAVRLKEGSDPDEAYRQALGWRDSHPRYAVMCSDRGLLLQGGPWPPREEWQAQLEALGLGGFISRLERLIQRHPDQLEARCLLVELLAHPQSWPRELDQERQDQRRTAIIGHLNKVIEVLPMALVVKLPVWGHLPITLSYSPFFQSQEHVFHGMRHWVPSVMASLTRQPEHPQLWGMAFVLHGMTGSPSLPELERMLPGPEVLPLSKLGPELTAMSAAVSHTEREPRYLAWVTRLWEKYRIEGGRPNPEAWEHLGKRLVRYYEDREKKAEAEALAQEWERITR